jgi:type I restriction enzyme R subunit
MIRNEALTRKDWIDPQLAAAGWNLEDRTQVAFEIPVDGYDAEPWNGVTDYCLYRSNGEVLAVVEAKRQSRSPQRAREQARHYVTEIGKRQSFQPFAFLANGQETVFWHVDQAAPRYVSGFFSRDDLERLLFIEKNKIALEGVEINSRIAGRLYQHEAIRRICTAFERDKKRRALLVMATGTGKTRTAMALIELFLRTNQARRVLFLADRDALVDQALTDGFKAHLPEEPRDRIYTHNIDKSKRLYVATLHTMGRCFDQFSPAFFDLLILDEAHRSIFNKLGEVMDYFDARMIGLTATPAKFIDRDTFRLFDCTNDLPTFLYSYRQAVEEGMLVDYSLYQAETKFQRKGIRGVDLSEEEQNALIEQGIDPDDVDYSGTEIEKTVSNRDTLRKQWDEAMNVCLRDESGQLPGKTIVFAMTQAHADRLRDVFEEMYPQYKGELVQVITSDTERVRDGSYGDGLITKFKKYDMPRIAISVDMLDTGIDVPEVVNLIFMKPVRSQIKLWQMIGRGTRNDEACQHREWLPEGRKTEFKIIDFWENEFGKEAEEVQKQAVPVLVTIFNTRLNILRLYLKQQGMEDCQRVIEDLRAQVAQIPLDSYAVKRVYPQIEEAWLESFWRFMSPQKLDFLRFKVAPLLRYVHGVDVAEATFTSKVERLKYQILTDKVQPSAVEIIREDVGRLPEFVYEKEACKKAIELSLSPALESASPRELSEVITALAPQMKYKREEPSALLKLDLQDIIIDRGYITLSEGGERIYVEEYRERVERRITEGVENHPTIIAIREGREVTDDQLIELERTLRGLLSGGDVQLSADNIRKAYGMKVGSFLAFLRHVLELDSLPDYETVVKRRFERYITEHTFSEDQIRFLSAVQSVFLRKRKLELADLYDAPALKPFGENAVDRFLSQNEVAEVLSLTEHLAA